MAHHTLNPDNPTWQSYLLMYHTGLLQTARDPKTTWNTHLQNFSALVNLLGLLNTRVLKHCGYLLGNKRFVFLPLHLCPFLTAGPLLTEYFWVSRLFLTEHLTVTLRCLTIPATLLHLIHSCQLDHTHTHYHVSVTAVLKMIHHSNIIWSAMILLMDGVKGG